MKQIRISQSFSLAISFGLLVGPLPMIAHEQVPVDQDRQKIAIHLSEVELQEIYNNPKRSYVYIGNDVSDIASIVDEIIKLDDNKNSILWGLRNHIKKGYVVSNYEAIRETLIYAERVIAQKNHQISQDQLDRIENALDELVYQIESGDLTIQRCCGNGFADQQDCSVSKLCCKGPRGPRGHRGHRGHTGATGPTGATGANGSTVTGVNVGAGTGLIFRDKTGIFINFKSLIQGTFFTITNNADDITFDVNGTNLNTPDTLVARDDTGSFAAQVISMVDGVVSQNIILETEPSSPTAGNVIKGSQRFIHDFGTNNTFVGIDAGNFTLTGTQNSGFGTNALTALTSGSGNTAIGYNTLPNTTSGSDNTAVGVGALQNYISGLGQNVAVGVNALNSNTGTGQQIAIGWNALASDTSSIFPNAGNVAVGYAALQANTDSYDNTAVGWSALTANTTGTDNTAVGNSALFFNTTGIENTALGSFTLTRNTIGINNTAVGYGALVSNTIGSDATAVGHNALLYNTANGNTAVGSNALSFNTVGSSNTAVGLNALLNNLNGIENVAVGDNALAANRLGVENVAVGSSALASNTTGSSNTAVGVDALSANVTGNGNIAIGSFAGTQLTSGDNNIYIGCINDGTDPENATIRIGQNNGGSPLQTACYIQGIRGATTGINDAVAVLIDSAGQLGIVSSSVRFKHNIADMGELSADILKLRPVTFAYNSDASETTQYGLIAEEVEQVFPAIVIKNADGQPETVQYHILPVLLLNELKKQQAKIEQQGADFASAVASINNRLVALEQHS